jgi:hypothetical protein
MNERAAECLPVALASLLTACASPEICTRDIKKCDPLAVALVTAFQRAHGQRAFAKSRDVSVCYEGR